MSLSTVVLLAVAADDQTPTTTFLNQLIASGGGGSTDYSGGKGVLLRQPDYLTGGRLLNATTSTQVVPASFIVNDIHSPSTVYPGMGAGKGNPMCPNTAIGGCDTDPNTGDSGPWGYAQLAYVVGKEMGQLFKDFENIQSASWGWGVFYASDANSCDHRCHYLPKYNGYDCPGYWLPFGGSPVADNSKMGAGYYPPGNPDAPVAEGGGGGTGCHFEWSKGSGIDQTDAYDDAKTNLVQDANCQCNYEKKGNGWQDWVDQWLAHAQPKSNEQWQYWFRGGKAPSYALDFAACWMNNPRDMINLQNALWKSAGQWSNQQIPQSDWTSQPDSQRVYWGWNEVPVARSIMDNPTNWDAIVVKLPAAVCWDSHRLRGQSDTVACLKNGYQMQLEQDLDTLIKNGLIAPGSSSFGKHPSSSIVFMREEYNQGEARFERTFYCEKWRGPLGKWEIVYGKLGSQNGTACYVQAAGTPPPAPPAPTPPGSNWTRFNNTNCYAGHGAQDMERPIGSYGAIFHGKTQKSAVDQCKEFCLTHPGPAAGQSGICTAFTVHYTEPRDGSEPTVECYRRRDVDYNATGCVASSAADRYDTFRLL